jgi:uncharacterized membrane protein YoaK (UPF0700 family)
MPTSPQASPHAKRATVVHPRPSVDLACAIVLCLVAGMVDAVGYVRHGAFAANMTGNTVLTAIALAERDAARAVDCGLMLACFFGGVIFGRLLLTLGRGRAAWPLTLEAALLVACVLMPPERWLALGTVALAMGVQAAALSRFAGVSVSTVVVTSTMVRLAEANIDFLLRFFGRAATAERAPWLLLSGVWLAYAVGALLAVLLTPASSTPVLVAAGLVIAVVMLRRGATP